MAVYDYLIIGGGIAGVTAAETIRENDAEAHIAIVSQEAHLLYSRVLLPSYLKRKILRNQLFLRTIEDFNKKKIDLHLNHEVVSVDTQKHEVRTASDVRFGYGKLLIATGGKVSQWGKESEEPFLLRLQTLDDADKIFEACKRIKDPLVIGSSFISLEFLEIFILNGIKPKLLSRDHYFFERFLDPRGGEILYDNFSKNGIEIQFNDSVSEIFPGNTLTIETKSMRRISCDALALGIGIERSMKFLDGSGIRVGERGVFADEFLKTNQPDVYVAGDVAEFFDTIRGYRHVDGNWTNAFLQGKRVGLNMVGKEIPFQNVSSYSITNLGFQITVLGDMSDASDTIVRIDQASRHYERLFLKQGVLQGSALINRFQDKPHLTNLVFSRVNIEAYRKKLADFEFDIRTIPV